MTFSEFRGPGLTEAQWQQVKALATSLDARQLQWISGFFAGVEHRDTASGGDSAPSTPEPSSPEAATPVRSLTVLYGSETGNSSALAAELVEKAKARGVVARLYDMAAYKVRQLKDEQDLLIVTSTYGEGDPPQPAAGFFEFVEGRKAPKLPDVAFAVLALGDSTYEHYCEAGKRLDRRFEELGAKRLRPRVDCDVDYEVPAAAWIAGMLEEFEGEPSRRGPAPIVHQTAPEHRQYTSFDKRNPCPARIIDNIILTGRGSSKETRHIELSLENGRLTYEPGDALGFMPRNDPALAETLLNELNLAASVPVGVGKQQLELHDALVSRFEISALTPRFIEQWSKIADSDELRRLTKPEQASERTALMRKHHIIDVIRRFPAKNVDPDVLAAGFRPLQPRLYSIASSLAVAPDEVHLTVSTVRYELHGEKRSGVASGYLADYGEPDGMLPVYVQANPHFRLPADDVAIIMIGAGTGVAPYRAFMQEREARGAAGRSWLFFGERNFRTDFLYQTEWQSLLKDGVLSRMDVAFSRDRRGNGKTYVQHRLQERSRDVFAWLEEGAHIYVCGDAAELAPGVHRTLATIVAAEGGFGDAAAADYLRRLQSDHRYQLDVY